MLLRTGSAVSTLPPLSTLTGFAPDHPYRIDYLVELLPADLAAGAVIVSATLTIQLAIGVGAPLITKVVTTTLTAAGQVTDTGAVDGLGALVFLLTAADTQQLATEYAYQVVVTDSLGRDTVLDQGAIYATGAAGTSGAGGGGGGNNTVDITGATEGAVPSWKTSLGIYKPRVPFAKTYNPIYPSAGPGAVGDSRIVTGLNSTGGSPILTAATAMFAATDVGKTIFVDSTQGALTELKTTVLSYQSPTQITLAAPCGITLVNTFATIGTDDTAAFLQILADWYAGGGGVIQISDPPGGGRYLITQRLTMPHDASSPRVIQPHGRITGMGIGQPVLDAALPVRVGGPQIDFHIQGGTAPKFLTVGLGSLEIDHITFFASGRDNLPFLQTTNTTIVVRRNLFHGNHFKAGTQCDQDCVVLGGDTQTNSTDEHSPFQGYVSVVEENAFDRIDRAVSGRVFANSCVVEKNWIGVTCGTLRAHGAPIEFSNGGTGATQNSTGGIIKDNVLELLKYKHGVALDGCQGFVLNNHLYDQEAGLLSFYYLAPNTRTIRNLIISGWHDSFVASSAPLVNADANPRNTVISSSQGVPGVDPLSNPAWLSSFFSEGLAASNLGVGLGGGPGVARPTGGGVGLIALPIADVVPTTPPASGFWLYTDATGHATLYAADGTKTVLAAGGGGGGGGGTGDIATLNTNLIAAGVTPVAIFDYRTGVTNADPLNWADALAGALILTAGGTQRPSVGAGGLTFDGVNDCLRVAGLSITGNSWVVFVGTPIAAGGVAGKYFAALHDASNSTNGLGHAVYKSSDNHVHDDANIGPGAFASPDNPILRTGTRVLHARRTISGGNTIAGVRWGAEAETTNSAVGVGGPTSTRLTVGANYETVAAEFGDLVVKAVLLGTGDYTTAVKDIVNSWANSIHGATL